MAYIILIVWMIVCYVLIIKNRRFNVEKGKKFFYIFFFVGCTIVMALRSESVGVDTQRYAQLFEMTKSVTINDMLQVSTYNRRIGYMLLMKLSGSMNGSYYFFQMVVSILFNYCSYKFISKNCESPFLAVSVFLGCGFYLSALNVARETLAVVIVLCAWNLLQEHKNIKALLLFIIAFSFHTTALVFLIAYLIYMIKDKQWVLRLLPIGVLAAAINYKTIIDFAAVYFISYDNYYKNKKTVIEAGGVTLIWIIIIALSVYCVYNKKKFSNMDRIYGVFCMICIVTDIIGMYFNYFDRLGTYFILFECLMLESVANSIESLSTKKLFKGGVSLSFLAYFLLSALTSAQYSYSTYL